MNIKPKDGYILISNYEAPIKKKSVLILEEPKYKQYYKIIKSDAQYKQDNIVIIRPFCERVQVDENLYLLKTDDILALVDFDDENSN